jgi:hypothetical protein
MSRRKVQANDDGVDPGSELDEQTTGGYEDTTKAISQHTFECTVGTDHAILKGRRHSHGETVHLTMEEINSNRRGGVALISPDYEEWLRNTGVEPADAK